MRAIICKSEEEFEQYEALACETLNLPSAHHENYATIEESGLVFPVLPEIEHLFSGKKVVEYTPDEDDG
tara:strand:+ start:2338 stop:2544 length:207 start_codon:yes stop_codon:yes gene_type:complete